jgi:hypothetical protein
MRVQYVIRRSVKVAVSYDITAYIQESGLLVVVYVIRLSMIRVLIENMKPHIVLNALMPVEFVKRGSNKRAI